MCETEATDRGWVRMAPKKAKKNKAAPRPAAAPEGAAAAPPREYPLRPTATMETSLGSFTFELLIDEAPVTAANYLALCESGFYEGLHVHRVVEDFVVQIGCPHSKDPQSELLGQGAPAPGSAFCTACGETVTREPHPEDPEGGYLVPDEFEAPACSRRSNKKHTLSAANAGPRSTGSQFFVNLADNDDLDWWTGEGEDNSQHVVFGRLLDGAATIDECARAKCVDEVPKKPIAITKVTVKWPSPADVSKVLKPEPGARVAHLLVAHGDDALSARTEARPLCATPAAAAAVAARLLARLKADPAKFAIYAMARSDCASFRYGGDCGPLAAPAPAPDATEARPPEPASPSSATENGKPAAKARPSLARRLSDKVLKAKKGKKVDPALGTHGDEKTKATKQSAMPKYALASTATRPVDQIGCLLDQEKLVAAARALPVGGLSEPIASPAGVHILYRSA